MIESKRRWIVGGIVAVLLAGGLVQVVTSGASPASAVLAAATLVVANVFVAFVLLRITRNVR